MKSESGFSLAIVSQPFPRKYQIVKSFPIMKISSEMEVAQRYKLLEHCFY